MPAQSPQDLEGELRKLKARVADRNRRLNTPTEVFPNPFGDGPGDPMKLYGTPHLRQVADEQNQIDEKAIEQIERLIRPQSLTEPDTKITSPATALVTRRSQPPRPVDKRVDKRKELIAALKGRHPGTLARRICELIDRDITTTPSRKAALAPLESWRERAPNERSWVGFYDHAKTHNPVRTYVNKVPALNTARKSSK